MNNTLRIFYSNKNEREAVKEFLILNLKEMGGERALVGESVAGIKDAKDAIEKSFDKLDELFGIISEPITINSK